MAHCAMGEILHDVQALRKLDTERRRLRVLLLLRARETNRGDVLESSLRNVPYA
jgi:hypothetical protein